MWKLKLKIGVVELVFKVLRLTGMEEPVLASATGIVINKGKILVIELSYKKGLALPGGLVKPGETFEEAVVREVAEETGLEVRVKRLIGVFPDYENFPTVNLAYECDQINGKLKSSREGNAKWIKINKATKLLSFGDNKQSLKKLKLD